MDVVDSLVINSKLLNNIRYADNIVIIPNNLQGL